MKVILHIGSDKCGSTAIQKALFQNAEKLREAGIVLTAKERGSSHDGVLCRETGRGRVLLADELGRSLDRCEELGAETAIITYEGLHSVTPASLAEAAPLLEKHEVRILYYVREQADYVNSALLQRAKARVEVMTLLDVYHGRKNAAWGHNYRKRLLKWETALPDAEITVRVFERGSLRNGDVVEDFLHCIGISAEGLVRKKGAVNTSITIETALALQYLEALGLREEDKGAVAIGAGNRLGGATRLLPRKQVLRIRLRNLLDNIRVARRYCDRFFLFRLKPLKRQPIDEERVVEILREVGRQLPHVYIRNDFVLRHELLGFLKLGFDTEENGVVLPEGDRSMRLRCGGRHHPEIFNELRLTFEIEGECDSCAVEIGDERREFADGKAEFPFSFSTFPILETFEARFEVRGGDCLLTRIAVQFT